MFIYPDQNSSNRPSSSFILQSFKKIDPVHVKNELLHAHIITHIRSIHICGLLAGEGAGGGGGAREMDKLGL